MTPAQRRRLSGPYLRLTTWRPYALVLAAVLAAAAVWVAGS